VTAPPVAGRPAPASEVARLYGLGLTMAEIAGVYGVSAWTVAARLDQAGVRRRRAGTGQAVLPLERAVASYRGQPGRLADLAAGLGVSGEVITGRAGRLPRGRRGQRRDRADVPVAEVAGLYREGWTVPQIAAAYRAAASTVLRRLDAAGVARRPPGVRVVFAVAEAARRAGQGASVAELARDYRVGVDAVRGQLRARGIHPPARRVSRALAGVPAADLAQLYASGLTMAAIAARYGVSRTTISARLRAAGITPRRAPRPPTTPIPVPEAAAQYRQGATLTGLAAAYHVTGRTLRRQLVAAGVTIRPPGGTRIPIPVAEAAQLYAGGQTMAQLAARYGVCETVIYDRLTEAGVPLRRKTDRKQVDPDLLAHLARLAGLDGLDGAR
jgi:uncharacterized protein (DUF433 family)